MAFHNNQRVSDQQTGVILVCRYTRSYMVHSTVYHDIRYSQPSPTVWAMHVRSGGHSNKFYLYYQLTKELIEKTTTKTGSKVIARIVNKVYGTGRKVANLFRT